MKNKVGSQEERHTFNPRIGKAGGSLFIILVMWMCVSTCEYVSVSADANGGQRHWSFCSRSSK